MGGLLRSTNAIVGMGLVGIGIAMIASPGLVVPEMYGKKKNGQRVKGEPSTGWVAIGCFEVFMGTVLCMSFYWGKEARFWLGLVYLLLMCALMYDLSENGSKAGLAPFGPNNFTYTALICTSCWYVVALVMNRLEPGYLTADKQTKYAVEGEKSSLLGAAKDKAKAASALDEERVEIVTYGASEETEPVATETKEPQREVVKVSEAAPGPAADVAREAEAEVVHRRWEAPERHPAEEESDEEESDGGDIAVDYGVSTDEEDAANDEKRTKKRKEKEGATEATKAEARAETEATEATKAGGKEGEKKEEPARAEEAPAAPRLPSPPPSPSPRSRPRRNAPSSWTLRRRFGASSRRARTPTRCSTSTPPPSRTRRWRTSARCSSCAWRSAATRTPGRRRSTSCEPLTTHFAARGSAACTECSGTAAPLPSPRTSPRRARLSRPRRAPPRTPRRVPPRTSKRAATNSRGSPRRPRSARRSSPRLSPRLRRVSDARRNAARMRSSRTTISGPRTVPWRGSFRQPCRPRLRPRRLRRRLKPLPRLRRRLPPLLAAAKAAEEEAAAEAKAEEEAAAAAKAEEEAAAAAKAEEEAAAAKAEEEEAAAAAAALAATALAAAAAKAEEEEAAAKTKAEEEAAAAAAKAKAKAEEDAAAAKAEEEEVFASPSTSEHVDDGDDEDPIAAAAFGSPAVEQSQSPERSEEDKLLDAAISSIRNLLTARHGAAYTPEQYDAWARHIGLSTGGAGYENPRWATRSSAAWTSCSSRPSEPAAGSRAWRRRCRRGSTRSARGTGRLRNRSCWRCSTTCSTARPSPRRPAGPRRRPLLRTPAGDARRR